MVISIEQVVVAVFVVVGVFALSTRMGIERATNRFVLYFKQRDQKNEIEYVVLAYFATEDPYILGKFVSTDILIEGESVTLNSLKETILCVGEITRTSTMNFEPNKPSHMIWVMLDKPSMYSYLQWREDGWKCTEIIRPPKHQD